jgi:hypothetical protein
MKKPIAVFLWIFFFAILFLGFDRNKSVDFYVYYFASAAFSQGDVVYDFSGESLRQIAKSKDFTEFFFNYYYYPPFTAQLLSPLTCFSPEVASIFWLGISVLCIVVSVFFLSSFIGEPHGIVISLGLFVFFLPVYITLFAGQINVLLVMMLVLALYGAVHATWTLAGISLATGALLKYIAIAHILLFIWKRKWYAAGVAMVGGLLLFFSALPWIGWKGYEAFFSMFRLMAFSHHSVSTHNLILEGFLHHVRLDSWDGVSLRLIRLLFTIVVISSVAYLCWPGRKNKVEIEFAFVTSSILLITPIVWYSFLVVLLVPIFVLIKNAMQTTPYDKPQLFFCGVVYTLINLYGVLFYTRLSAMLSLSAFFESAWHCVPYAVMLAIWLNLFFLLVVKRYPEQEHVSGEFG